MIWSLRLSSAVALLMLSAAVTGEGVRIGSVRLEIEHRVGYFLGDLVPYDAVVTVDTSWHLRDSSLPTPGHPDYWLELRSVGVTRTALADARRYRVHLVYQTFYAPIEARTREIPGFPLVFEHDGIATTIAVPSLTITMSPLREVATGTGDPEENVKPNPDRIPGPESLRTPVRVLLLSALVLLASMVCIAWQRGLWPFARSVPRPFSALARQLRRASGPGSSAYAHALRSMHRAFDATAGWRVFAEDQSRFLAEWPRFQDARKGIESFFDASRWFFFRNDAEQARRVLAAEQLLLLAQQLGRLERGQ